MFLDDELYQIAKNADYKHWLAKSETCTKITACVIDRITQEAIRLSKDPKSKDEDLLVFIKRCKKHWYNTINKLQKEGIVLFYGNDGCFETIIKGCPFFKRFEDLVLNYIK